MRHPRPTVGAVAGAVGLLLLGACGGGDRGASTGDTVDGRAPSTTEAPAPLAPATVRLTPIAELDSPIKLVARPGTRRLYVALKHGEVVLLPEGGSGAPTTVLDLSPVTTDDGERGLLGLAFSPDGATLYVHHSGPDGETRVASYPMTGDAVAADERIDLLTVEQPYPNHNGGDLVVGPDGLVWLGLGDGGARGDPEDRAQDPEELLGKILRIDPSRPGRAEVVVTGVRNPWRFSFDSETGDLWVADVGQDRWEEISHLPAGSILGANLGWSRMEGSTVFDPSRTIQGAAPTDPVFEMSHDDDWCAVTGGPVLHDARLPTLDGAYLFGDYCKPGLNALRLGDDGSVEETVVLDDGAAEVVSIDVDLEGRAYVVSLGGTVQRVDPG